MKIFMFHDIINTETEKLPTNRLQITGLLDTKLFQQKLDYLCANYIVISLKDFYTKNYNINDYDKLCILTFDDGLKSQYINAYPILKERNIPASFFISVANITEYYVAASHKIQFLIHDSDIETVFTETIKFLKTNNRDIDNLWETKTKSTYANNNWSSKQIFLTNILREKESRVFVDILFSKYVLDKLQLTEKGFCELFYINYDDILELKKNGMEIGGHGFYHEFIEDNENMPKIQKFMEELHLEYNFYSYPNGKITTMIDSFCVMGLTTECRSVELSDNLMRLPRVNCSLIPTTNKIILCGVQSQGLEICKYLINNGININYVITISKELAEKNKAAGWIDYTQFAKDYNIPIYYAKTYSLKSKEDLDFFSKNNFDIVLLGGWQRLIPEEILKTLKYGAIGQHGSSELLPRGRGRSPINWSILTNRKRIVRNIFYITPGIDDGDIIDSANININEQDTVCTVYYKISIIIKQMYKKNIIRILEGNVQRIKQIGEPTFYGKRTEDDGKIQWNQAINDIYNHVRSVTKPYPGSFTMNGLTKLRIWKVQPFDYNILYHNKKIGEIVELFEDGNFVVNCVDGTLLVSDYEGGIVQVGDLLT
jgi:methionyl-tRNA formyltransferase